MYVELAAQTLNKPSDEVTDKERQLGKVWFLMSLYGAGPRKVSAELGISYAEALDFYKKFHRGLPQLKQLSNPPPRSEKAMRFWQPGKIERTLRKRNYITTHWGRHLHVPEWGEHKMVNKLIQGSAADLMKASLLRIDAYLRDVPGSESRMVSVIHDEVIFDGPENEIEFLNFSIPPLMREDWLHEVVPIEVDHEVSLTNWADKISYEEWRELHG